MPTLAYRSAWSQIKPLSYSDDCQDCAVNKLLDRVLKTRKTKRLILRSGKMYYIPSNEYREFVIRIKQTK